MSTDSATGRKKISHDRILEVAAQAIRRHGYAGVGVADVMKQAGLTHGGFYAHFASREAMLAEAMDHAGQASAEVIARRVEARGAQGESPIRALIELYLSEKHLASPENGCPVAALCSEMPRQEDELRDASRRRVQALLSLVSRFLPNGMAAEHAMTIASTLVGALQLARVLGNNVQGKAVLAASRKALIDQYDTGGTVGAVR